jgi:hypothetical protein
MGQPAMAEKVGARQPAGSREWRDLQDEIQDEHHILVKCPTFGEWREQAGPQLSFSLGRTIRQGGLIKEHKSKNLTKAKHFNLDNSDIWPLKES